MDRSPRLSDGFDQGRDVDGLVRWWWNPARAVRVWLPIRRERWWRSTTTVAIRCGPSGGREFQSVHLRHHQVEQADVRLELRRDRECGHGVVTRTHLAAHQFEHRCERVRRIRMVVDYKNAKLGQRGISRIQGVPDPTLDCASDLSTRSSSKMLGSRGDWEGPVSPGESSGEVKVESLMKRSIRGVASAGDELSTITSISAPA